MLDLDVSSAVIEALCVSRLFNVVNLLPLGQHSSGVLFSSMSSTPSAQGTVTNWHHTGIQDLWDTWGPTEGEGAILPRKHQRLCCLRLAATNNLPRRRRHARNTFTNPIQAWNCFEYGCFHFSSHSTPQISQPRVTFMQAIDIKPRLDFFFLVTWLNCKWLCHFLHNSPCCPRSSLTSVPCCWTDGRCSKDVNCQGTNWVKMYLVYQMAPYGTYLHLLREAKWEIKRLSLIFSSAFLIPSRQLLPSRHVPRLIYGFFNFTVSWWKISLKSQMATK